MDPEPVHGNLSHAMRDNYAEHGVDKVRPTPLAFHTDYSERPFLTFPDSITKKLLRRIVILSSLVSRR